MENCFAEESGEITERSIAYYRERAKGGAGPGNTRWGWIETN
jgi:2,4-dienoyl-CoA reductase-like NADH-dependent reductase (Old Yellow Enzyme family)